jgi:DNA primase
LKTTQGKTDVVNKVLPILAEVKSGPRQYQYLTSLALTVGIDEQKLEASLGRYKIDRKAKETRPQAILKATRSLGSNPVEEYILAILLQHPEIAPKTADLLVDYFQNSENRAIFEVWKGSVGITADLSDLIDNAIQDHFKKVLNRPLPGDEIEDRYADCLLRLRESYLRNIELRKAALLTAEAESGVKNADLSKLEELGFNNSLELNKLKISRAKSHGKEMHEKR